MERTFVTTQPRMQSLKCLKIADKWIRLILSGKKTWEIHRTSTRVRGRIGLGNTKNRNCEGYATIVDCREMPVGELKGFNGRHWANDFLDGYASGRGTLFAWVLEEVEVALEPRPYSFSTGSWCKVHA